MRCRLLASAGGYQIPVDSKSTFAFKERLRIGAEIAKQLDPLMTREQVAQELGISEPMVRRIECLALYKISVRMKEIRAGEDEPLSQPRSRVPSVPAHMTGEEFEAHMSQKV